jgi:hypothetical protein
VINSAVTHANKAKRKTLAVSDILAAIGDMEFEQFVQPLNEALKSMRRKTFFLSRKAFLSFFNMKG